MTFGECAFRLGSLASRQLCLRPDDFWNLTPTEFSMLLGPSNPHSRPPTIDEIKSLRMLFPDG